MTKAKVRLYGRGHPSFPVTISVRIDSVRHW